MPEALVIVAILFVSLAAYFYARIQAANPALQTPELDLARLRQHTDWLQHRLQIARRENWDEAMIADLNADLETTSRELARQQGIRSV